MEASKSLQMRQPHETREKARAISRAIEGVKRDAHRLKDGSRQELEEVAERYARAPSAFLAGIVGGALGAAGGVGIAALGGGVMVVTGPIGLALGAALGVLR